MTTLCAWTLDPAHGLREGERNAGDAEVDRDRGRRRHLRNSALACWLEPRTALKRSTGSSRCVASDTMPVTMALPPRSPSLQVHRDRHVGQQRFRGQRVTVLQVAPQRRAAQRQHELVDRRLVGMGQGSSCARDPTARPPARGAGGQLAVEHAVGAVTAPPGRRRSDAGTTRAAVRRPCAARRPSRLGSCGPGLPRPPARQAPDPLVCGRPPAPRPPCSSKSAPPSRAAGRGRRASVLVVSMASFMPHWPSISAW